MSFLQRKGFANKPTFKENLESRTTQTYSSQADSEPVQNLIDQISLT